MAGDMAPWDRLPDFNQPTEKSFGLNAVAPTLLAPGDPMRVMLMFTQSLPTAVSLTVNWPIPIAFSQAISITIPVVTVTTNQNQSGTSGFFLPITGDPIVLDYRTHGPLVCAPWYGRVAVSGTFNVTVFSVSMQEWPESKQSSNLIQQVNDGTFRSVANGYPNGVRRAKLYGNRWVQQQEEAPYSLSKLLDSRFPRP